MITSLSFWIVLFGLAAIYWMLPRGRTYVLAIASFAFLLTVDVWSVLALAGWATLFYQVAPRLGRGDTTAKFLFGGLLFSILGYLAWFKYLVPWLAPPPSPRPLIPQFFYDPQVGQVVIPLGISYFTFKLIHYAIEMARGNIPRHSPGSFFLYMTLLPVFPAGPIERFDHFLSHQERRFSVHTMTAALHRIQCGLIKKFFIGEVLILPLLQRPTTAELLGSLDQVPAVLVWWHVIGAFLYAYMDFAGYSDIAIGASRLFGLRIMENFNHPLMATNIGDFWKRWHMTLSGWCQAYVYMPMLGLTRNPYLATCAAMMAIGLWHGGTSSWVCWGLYHATGLAVYLTYNRLKRRRRWRIDQSLLYRVVMRIVTLLFVSGSYTFVVTNHHGGPPAAFRLLAKLVGIDVTF